MLAPGDDAASYWSGVAWNTAGTAYATVRFTAVPGFSYRLEGNAPGDPVTWLPLDGFSGDGLTRTLPPCRSQR